MWAWILHGVGDIRWETVEKPAPSAREALVAVKAAGLCGSDIPRVFETGAHVHPLIIGHEFAGIVEAVGQDVDPYWLRKRVGVFPLLPCGACTFCKSGRYELCRGYTYLGSSRNGGFSEYAVVPAGNLVALPDDVSLEEAAMLEPMAVAVHAMRRGTEEFVLQKDMPVAVCGLGTIGLLLIMFLREAGYRNICAIGNKDSQRRRAYACGIFEEHYFDSRRGDAAVWMQEYMGGTGLFFECTGRNAAAVMGVRAVRPEGKVILVGNPCSDMTFDKDTYWKILRNQLTVTGTWNSSFAGKEGDGDDWHYAMERLRVGRIAPGHLISHLLAPEKLKEGLLLIRDKTEDFCKVMIVPPH